MTFEYGVMFKRGEYYEDVTGNQNLFAFGRKGAKEMYEKLRDHILPQLIPPNARVMVAVSGGPDSMALSHILWRYMQEENSKGISLVLTHIHHGVRKESDDEVHLVQQMAAKWETPCLVHYFDALGYAKAMGQSFQEAAREWRYARWKEDMNKEGCTLLATAHHLGDQAETILYRLLRGSGTAGLAGIYPAKDSIIRPLLMFTKAEILNYCAQEALPYALDRSNEESVYVRNRIRLELLPELEKGYNPRIQEALGRTGELLRWDEEYLARQVEGAWTRYYLNGPESKIGLSCDVFNEPAAILSRLLRKAAMLVSQEPRGLGFAYVTKIMGSQGRIGWMQDLPGMTTEITKDGIWFSGNGTQERSEEVTIFDEETLDLTRTEISLDIGRWSEVPSLKVDVGLFEESDLISENSEKQEKKVASFSRDLLTLSSDHLVCRTRRQGDKMWVQGTGHKSLKKIFQEENVSAKSRATMLLLACGSEVLWIPGVRQSSLFQPDQNTENIYCIFKSRGSDSNLDSL